MSGEPSIEDLETRLRTIHEEMAEIKTDFSRQEALQDEGRRLLRQIMDKKAAQRTLEQLAREGEPRIGADPRFADTIGPRAPTLSEMFIHHPGETGKSLEVIGAAIGLVNPVAGALVGGGGKALWIYHEFDHIGHHITGKHDWTVSELTNAQRAKLVAELSIKIWLHDKIHHELETPGQAIGHAATEVLAPIATHSIVENSEEILKVLADTELAKKIGTLIKDTGMTLVQVVEEMNKGTDALYPGYPHTWPGEENGYIGIYKKEYLDMQRICEMARGSARDAAMRAYWKQQDEMYREMNKSSLERAADWFYDKGGRSTIDFDPETRRLYIDTTLNGGDEEIARMDRDREHRKWADRKAQESIAQKLSDHEAITSGKYYGISSKQRDDYLTKKRSELLEKLRKSNNKKVFLDQKWLEKKSKQIGHAKAHENELAKLRCTGEYQPGTVTYHKRQYQYWSLECDLVESAQKVLDDLNQNHPELTETQKFDFLRATFFATQISEAENIKFATDELKTAMRKATEGWFDIPYLFSAGSRPIDQAVDRLSKALAHINGVSDENRGALVEEARKVYLKILTVSHERVQEDHGHLNGEIATILNDAYTRLRVLSLKPDELANFDNIFATHVGLIGLEVPDSERNELAKILINIAELHKQLRPDTARTPSLSDLPATALQGEVMEELMLRHLLNEDLNPELTPEIMDQLDKMTPQERKVAMLFLLVNEKTRQDNLEKGVANKTEGFEVDPLTWKLIAEKNKLSRYNLAQDASDQLDKALEDARRGKVDDMYENLSEALDKLKNSLGDQAEGLSEKQKEALEKAEEAKRKALEKLREKIEKEKTDEEKEKQRQRIKQIEEKDGVVQKIKKHVQTMSCAAAGAGAGASFTSSGGSSFSYKEPGPFYRGQMPQREPSGSDGRPSISFPTPEFPSGKVIRFPTPEFPSGKVIRFPTPEFPSGKVIRFPTPEFPSGKVIRFPGIGDPSIGGGMPDVIGDPPNLEGEIRDIMPGMPDVPLELPGPPGEPVGDGNIDGPFQVRMPEMLFAAGPTDALTPAQSLAAVQRYTTAPLPAPGPKVVPSWFGRKSMLENTAVRSQAELERPSSALVPDPVAVVPAPVQTEQPHQTIIVPPEPPRIEADRTTQLWFESLRHQRAQNHSSSSSYQVLRR